MKTRIFILLAVTAIVTLSFTFVTVRSNNAEVKVERTLPASEAAPIGGFALEGAL